MSAGVELGTPWSQDQSRFVSRVRCVVALLIQDACRCYSPFGQDMWRELWAHLSTHSLPGAMPKNFSFLSPGLPGPLGSRSGSVSWKSVASMYTTLLRGTG